MCKELCLAGVVNDSVTDGPGLRFVIFVQGCPHRCEGCHNPEALAFDGGYGVTVEELWNQIRRNPLLKGVTFSGGEPFAQAKALLPLAKLVKEGGYELAIYTGYLYEELVADKNSPVYELLVQADTIVDGPFDYRQRDLNLKFRGSANQRVIDVKSSLASEKVVIDKGLRWNNCE